MKKDNQKASTPIEFSLRVLGYREEDGTWAAHCLETDLVGYGKDFEEAFANLRELTEMQISFALQTDQPNLLDRPAPPEILEKYLAISRAILSNYPKRRKSSTEDMVATIILPPNPRSTNIRFVAT